MNEREKHTERHPRRGVTLVIAVLLTVLMLAMIAFAVDIGYVVLVRTQLQVAADSSAMSAAASMGLPRAEMEAVAEEYAAYHATGGKPVELLSKDVEYGTWDVERRFFTPSATPGNAIRITARTDPSINGKSRLFFGKILNRFEFSQKASAVAMANPRDIAFVIDLSGSMNNDTEPCWVTDAINDAFAADGYPTVGSDLMQDLYDDFGYGSYPGTLQYFGAPFGVPQSSSAYYELTKNGGPLTGRKIPSKYRIRSKDSKTVRKRKAYSAVIDYQLRKIMPKAKPPLNSSKHYAYWEKYLDYVVYGGHGSSRRPPNQDSDRIDRFNNPNRQSFPALSSSVPRGYRNRLGYRTYVQFMVDHGRDLKPIGGEYVPLSKYSRYCPWHTEDTAGGRFKFPPRTQPMHAARRALIAAMQVVKERNASIGNLGQRDWVSIVTFDTLTGGGPVVVQELTGDYDEAMEACTRLQAVGDKYASTATESGLIEAREHLASESDGGEGRYSANKVVVLLTDGMPNLYSSSRSEINSFISNSESNEFYGGNAYKYDAPLMQAMQMQADNWYTFPVGVGLGTDYDFMDRLSRSGGTANDDGQSPRGSGNPAEYEERLKKIFEEIITNPKVRLVQ